MYCAQSTLSAGVCSDAWVVVLKPKSESLGTPVALEDTTEGPSCNSVGGQWEPVSAAKHGPGRVDRSHRHPPSRCQSAMPNETSFGTQLICLPGVNARPERQDSSEASNKSSYCLLSKPERKGLFRLYHEGRRSFLDA